MDSSNFTLACAPNMTPPSNVDDLTDIYITVYFDGTGNNMYEQINKERALSKKTNDAQSKVKGAISSVLFKSSFIDNAQGGSFEQKVSELEQYGMNDYESQKKQAEKTVSIPTDRSSQSEPGQLKGDGKYSNVAIMRSLTHSIEQTETNNSKQKVVGRSYSLYIEGSGQNWDTGDDFIGLGMGTGRTGVTGTVSKALVFITNYLSDIGGYNRSKIKLHFAIFGFSRGSACGRVLSFLIASPNKDCQKLPKMSEFNQFLPDGLYDGKTFKFLDVFKENNNVKVDFLGIFDTVSSIGFLLKQDNKADGGINSFHEISEENGKYKGYVNKLSSVFKKGQKYIDAKKSYHCFNCSEYGLYSPQLCNVEHTFQICALDEYRENFALVDLGKTLKKGCTEVLMPGCHSDIGGGYTFEEPDKKITLRRQITGKERSKKDEKETKVTRKTKLSFDVDPRIVDTTLPVSQDSLKELGWFTRTAEHKQNFLASWGVLSDNPEIAKCKFETEKERTEKSNEQTVYIDQNDEKIEFRRFVREGYSNIPLYMMMKRASGSKGVGLKGVWPDFFLPFVFDENLNNIPKRFHPPVNDACLKWINDKSKENFAEGKRQWLIPPRADYLELRRKYLHFTCTDELNYEDFNNSPWGNIGNPPNWKYQEGSDDFLLCRIVYHGDSDDNKIHYMQDL